jgi:hypothetical protein
MWTLDPDFLARAMQGGERVEVQRVDGVQMWVSMVVMQQAVG